MACLGQPSWFGIAPDSCCFASSCAGFADRSAAVQGSAVQSVDHFVPEKDKSYSRMLAILGALRWSAPVCAVYVPELQPPVH